MSYRFNYQSDKEHIADVQTKAPSVAGVVNVTKLADTLLGIEYDRTVTDMGKLIKAFRAMRVQKPGEPAEEAKP